MSAIHDPNPLDLMFFVADRAARGLGIPNLNIQIILELGGRLDVVRLRRAVRALLRRHPAAGGRLVVAPLTGRPCWRLAIPTERDLKRIVRVYDDRSAGPAGVHRRIENLYNESITAPDLPPVRFCVLRAEAAGDVLMVRFRHALMDARGATFFLEDLDELYARDTAGAEPDAPAGGADDDYARLAGALPAGRRLRETLAALAGVRQAVPAPAALADPSVPLARAGPLRIVLRHLGAVQTQAVRDAALRVCGFGRFGDFLRACALKALRSVLPRVPDPATPLSTLHLVNHRKRRARAPVCRNLTSAVPLAVSAGMADDLVATADRLRDQMLEHMAGAHAARQFAVLAVLTRLPMALAAAAVRRSWTAAASGGGLFRPPSLPLGLMGAFTRPMETFCGQKLENYYGLATARPRPGYTIDVNLTGSGMNLCGAYYEGLVPRDRIERLLDRTIDLMRRAAPS